MSGEKQHTEDRLLGVAPYSRLAGIYDSVMEHVDYDAWASYVVSVLARHAIDVKNVLELGCGTGSFALAFSELLDVEYLATDGAPNMVRRAREKLAGTNIRVEVADFLSFQFDISFDLIVLLYDGINYVLDERDIVRCLEHCYNALSENGVLVFDQSTPVNSENNDGSFDYSGEWGDISYIRKSQYDGVGRIHVTDFTIRVGGRRYWERHMQKAYHISELRHIIQRTPFTIVAEYEDFTFRQATEKTERIHWLVRRGTKQ